MRGGLGVLYDVGSVVIQYCWILNMKVERLAALDGLRGVAFFQSWAFTIWGSMQA